MDQYTNIGRNWGKKIKKREKEERKKKLNMRIVFIQSDLFSLISKVERNIEKYIENKGKEAVFIRIT